MGRPGAPALLPAAYIAIARYARQVILRHAHLENLALPRGLCGNLVVEGRATGGGGTLNEISMGVVGTENGEGQSPLCYLKEGGGLPPPIPLCYCHALFLRT